MVITTPEQLNELENGNKFIGTPPVLEKSKITFKGKNNILYCDEGVVLNGSHINFNGSNSVVFLSKSEKYNVHIFNNNNSAIYIGEGTTFNTIMKIAISERKHIFIGKDCMFSLDIWIRNGEPHLIYDTETKMRKNPSKSVFIGDHVWLGQHSLILKGTKIHSGSIVGAGSIVAGKTIPSNESWCGVPAKKIGDKLFWDRPSVHTFTKKQTEESMYFEDDIYIFENEPEKFISFDEIDAKLDSFKSADDKFNYLMTIHNNTEKNRFAYKPEPIHKPVLPWYKRIFKK